MMSLLLFFIRILAFLPLLLHGSSLLLHLCLNQFVLTIVVFWPFLGFPNCGQDHSCLFVVWIWQMELRLCGTCLTNSQGTVQATVLGWWRRRVRLSASETITSKGRIINKFLLTRLPRWYAHYSTVSSKFAYATRKNRAQVMANFCIWFTSSL